MTGHFPTRAARRVLVVLTATAVVTAACGSDDGVSPASPANDTDTEAASDTDTEAAGEADTETASEPDTETGRGGNGYFRAVIDDVEYILELGSCRNALGSGELEFWTVGDERVQGALSGEADVDSISISWEEPFLRWRISPPGDGRIDELALAPGRATGRGVFSDHAGIGAPGSFEVDCTAPVPSPTMMTPDQIPVETLPPEVVLGVGDTVADIFGPDDDRRAVVSLDACAGDMAQLLVAGTGFEPGELRMFVGPELVEDTVTAEGSLLVSVWVEVGDDLLVMLSDSAGVTLSGAVSTASLC